MEPNIAVFGTGRMGYPLVQRLLELGYQVTAYNRTIEKAALLAQDGAKIAALSGEAAADSQLLLIMVSNADVVSALLDEMGEYGMKTGKTMIVMSTISSEESERLRDRMISRGDSYLEAPVMGGPADVRKGRLTIMLGAEEHDYKTWEKFLGGLARNLVWTGPIGSACVVKLALNQFMAALVTALATSVALVRAVDIPAETLMDILKEFPYYAPTYESKLPRMLSGNFEDPNFTIEMMGKDVRLMVQEARRHHVYPDALEAIHNLYRLAEKEGLGELDYSAIFKLIDSPDP